MTLKYASKQKIFAYVLLSLIYACGNVAIAYVTKIMLNLAQYKQGDIRDLIKVAIDCRYGCYYSDFIFQHSI
ncbi:hypothetical protein [Lactobacillus helveticus]|uniref:hypothetical protein n=1 Tax=Lactobacillus helveticus TaxID=1587 RepID=UPI000A9C3140|nr:hypothetical protein [Lactobacillus helveticus]